MTIHGPAIDIGLDDWPEIDIGVAQPARVHDFLLGGRANFAVDRVAAELTLGTWPGGLAAVRAEIRADRAGFGRIVRFLAGEAGIRQFLDAGTGIPNERNTHEIAQAVRPEARIVYADNDPMVLAFAHKLLASTPEGACGYVFADARDTEAILAKAGRTLDLRDPVAVLLSGLLHYLPGAGEASALVAEIVRALAPGSYLVIAHLGSEADAAEGWHALGERMARRITLRSRTEVERFFGGLTMIHPAVAMARRWRPEPGADPGPDSRLTVSWCGAGRKD